MFGDRDKVSQWKWVLGIGFLYICFAKYFDNSLNHSQERQWGGNDGWIPGGHWLASLKNDKDGCLVGRAILHFVQDGKDLQTPQKLRSEGVGVAFFDDLLERLDHLLLVLRQSARTEK